MGSLLSSVQEKNKLKVKMQTRVKRNNFMVIVFSKIQKRTFGCVLFLGNKKSSWFSRGFY